MTSGDSGPWEQYRLFAELMAETEHIIQFTNEGWTIAHPLRERLDLDTLFDCPMRWDFGDIGMRGRFWLYWNEEGEPEVGGPLARAERGEPTDD